MLTLAKPVPVHVKHPKNTAITCSSNHELSPQNDPVNDDWNQIV